AASAAPVQTAADTPVNGPSKVQQPKPQALPSRAGPSSILVSPRQKGNPILNGVRAVAWEYSDIPADYVLGATTCALFLSLKYHRLHPEYIYNRIRDLRGQYNLRILLTMVDIENHEESLRELSKTSLINNVTIMLCWSAQEAGRYLELFKNFENAAPTSIRAQQSSSYSDKLVEFITVPRSINKTDALGLVSNFGSIRTAVNAGPEEVGLIAGWGEKKVQRWCNAVREPFRIKKAARRGVNREDTRATMSRDTSRAEADDQIVAESVTRLPVGSAIPVDTEMPPPEPSAVPDADRRPAHRLAEDTPLPEPGMDEEEASREAEQGPLRKKHRSEFAQRPSADSAKKAETGKEDMSEGIVAALSKLRQHFVTLHNNIAVRTICRQFGENAFPPLFRRVVACARYKALSYLRNVSLHPRYAKYVEEIVYDGSVYRPLLAHRAEHYHSIADRILPRQPLWDRHQNFKRYQALYQDQEEMMDDGVLLAELARALSWMPRVTTITYSPGPHFFPSENKLMKNILPRGTNVGQNYPGNHIDSHYEYSSYGPHHLHGFHHLIGAIYEAQYSDVHEFRVIPAESRRPMSGTEFSLDHFDFVNPIYVEAGKYFFGRLRKMDMCLDLFFSHASSPLSQLCNVKVFLEAAQELEDLAFTVPHWRPSASWMYPRFLTTDRSLFSYLGLEAQWPNLRSLHLGGIYVLEEEVLSLITRHMATLRKLSFTYCSLQSGTWANIVDEVLLHTSILPCILDRVNETVVASGPISHIDFDEMRTWQYVGEVKLVSNGGRYFV
ncbi:hypothetical protein K491DRAFT_572617, partial [Lophiostoma macrostomum CBS 122681]